MFPEAVRKPALLAVPVLMVLVAVLYWFVSVRMTPRFDNYNQRRRFPTAASTAVPK